MIDLLAAHQLVCLLLQVLFRALCGDRKLEAIREEGFLLDRIKSTVHNQKANLLIVEVMLLLYVLRIIKITTVVTPTCMMHLLRAA